MQQWEYAQIYQVYNQDQRWLTFVHFSSGEESWKEYDSPALAMAGRLGNEGWEMVHYLVLSFAHGDL